MKKLLVSLIVILALYWTWSKLTTPYGEQTVNYTPASKECFSEASFKYCIYKAKQGVNGDIAYHLHGKDLDENSWNDETYYTAMVQKYWTDHAMLPPTVVSVSFGPVWLLAQKNNGTRSGLLEVFENDVLKSVEAKLGQPEHRLVFGESMGGLNSLVLALKTRGVFSKVASLCPVIYNEKPSASWIELKALSQRTGADPKLLFGIKKLLQSYISNDTEWDSFSPLELLKQYTVQKGVKFYLSCGLYDKYGNYEGTELLENGLKSKGVPVEWHPLYGNHCVIDVPSLAQFLVDR